MSNKKLNIVVAKKDLDLVVARAGLAAMSEEGQSDMIRASNETRGCIRIVASGGKIVFESSVSRISARHVLTAGEGETEIISDGETCIPAKELKTVSNKIKDGRKVSISFLPTPPDPTITANPSMKAVLPDGVVEIGVISGSRVVSKTKIESYPSFHFAAPQYQETSELTEVIKGTVACLKQPCNTVSFAVNDSDLKEVYDKFAIFPATDGICFLGSDGRRAAVAFVKGDAFEEFLSSETDTPVLLDAKFLSPALSSLQDGAPLVLGLDAEQDRAYLCSENTTYCINMIDKALRGKYPNYKRIMGLKTHVVVLVNRDELSETMGLMNIVNNDRGTHTFCRDEQIVKISGRGIGVVKETTGSVAFTLSSEDTIKSNAISLNTQYLVEGLKRMSCDNVKMSFSEDELRVRIEDEVEPKFVYFMQVMNPNEV